MPNTTLPKDVEQRFEKLWRDQVKVAGNNGENVIYTLVDGIDRFKQFLADELAKAKQMGAEEALGALDKSIAEFILSVPSATENWQTWNRIKNMVIAKSTQRKD